MTYHINLKKFFFLPILVISFLTASAQDFNGTWKGIYRANDMIAGKQYFPSRTYYLTFQLHQSGRAVWGAYTVIDSITHRGKNCLCKVSGELGKHNKGEIDLFDNDML